MLITTANLPAPDGGPETPLGIWDFGGQDIYHGTHALFVRSRAVFMLVWSDGTERDRRPEYEHQGITFRNHPLAYWVDYVRHCAHAEGPTLIVPGCRAPGRCAGTGSESARVRAGKTRQRGIA